MSNFFSDPWKLVPCALALGAMVLMGLGKIDTTHMLELLGLAQAIHSGTSAINNPK